MSDWWNKPYCETLNDAVKQARWEVELERFEQEVEKEKARIRAKRAWFPWRIKIVKVT